MGEFTELLDEAQLAVWDAVCRLEYETDKNDCSNKAYQLFYFWRRLGHNPKIYLCVTSGFHAQVELPGKGYYDPAQRSKIEKKKCRKLKPASKAKKLPGYAGFIKYMDAGELIDSNEYFMTPLIYNKLMNLLRKYESYFNTRVHLNIKEEAA